MNICGRCASHTNIIVKINDAFRVYQRCNYEIKNRGDAKIEEEEEVD